MAFKLNIEMIKNCISFVITTSQLIMNLLTQIEKGISNG